MSALVGIVVGVALGLVQLGAAPVLFGDPRAAPLIPIAVLAGWSATRGSAGVAAGLLGAALVLGCRRADEVAEKRVRPAGARGELRVGGARDR